MSKSKITFASGEQGGYTWRKELDLSKGDFQSILVPNSVNEFAKFYVYIKTMGCVGIAGTAEVFQGPTSSPSTHDIAPIGSINLSPDGQGSSFGEIHGGFLSVKLPALPTVGLMEVIVVAKNN